MRLKALILIGFAILWGSGSTRAEDMSKSVREAVGKSRLNQPGTKPFHLKAVLAPSFERDKGSNRVGEVEIWWRSPDSWRREVRSPEFHQVQIVNGGKVWQKNEGEYFPEWLRNLAVELVDPVPSLDDVLQKTKQADVRSLMGQRHAQWMTTGSDGTVSKGIGAGIALNDADGLVFYGGDVGWDGMFHDYKDFHGRKVAMKVSAGSPEVTAKITVLEDLASVDLSFFDAGEASGDAQQINTVVVDELTLRKSLIPVQSAHWPSLTDGPLEGVMITRIVVDREGKVQDVGTIVSDNPGVGDAATQWIKQQRFKAYLVNGVPAQVISTMTLPFKTTRPAGVENFDSAKSYFEKGRKFGFLADGAESPYLLHAEFQAKAGEAIVTGRYEDTWFNEHEWRREAWFAKSHYVRSRNGDTRYQLAEGPEVGLIKVVFTIMEPIPATDTFIESDWRMKRELVNGVTTVRVASGYESPDGKPNAVRFRSYWFDDTGQLVKTYSNGLETQRLDFSAFDCKQVARLVNIRKDGRLAMQLRVTDLHSTGMVEKQMFVLQGHEWERAFTSEVR